LQRYLSSNTIEGHNKRIQSYTAVLYSPNMIVYLYLRSMIIKYLLWVMQK